MQSPGQAEGYPEKMTIHQRMACILSELPAIGKDAYNQQQSFHYRSHDDVLNALNPLLAKWGVFVVPNVLERTTSERKTRSGGTMYEVNLHVSYTFYGLDGDSLTASAWGEGTDSGDKSTNKAMTMAFKNVLAQSFAVSTADTIDSDGQTPEETEGRTERGGRRVTGELEALIEEIKQLDLDPAHGGGHYYQVAVNAAAKYHGKTLEDLTAEEMADIIGRFRGLRDSFLPEETQLPGEAKAELPVEETVVRAGPAPFTPPTSWAEIEAAVRAYDEATWEAHSEFLLQAKEHLFPSAERMSQQRKDLLFQKAASVACKLRDTHDPGEMPPPNRLEFQAHWALLLDGTVLPGPEWSMSPDEAKSRPARGSGEEPGAGTPAEGADGTEAPSAPQPSPEENEKEVLAAVEEEFNHPPEVKA